MHGAVFAIRVQSFLRAGVIAVQTLGRPLLSPGAEIGSKTLVQCRGTSLGEATFESRYRSFLVSSGADPGLRYSVILLTAGLNAKTVTSLFTLLSVLGYEANYQGSNKLIILVSR